MKCVEEECSVTNTWQEFNGVHTVEGFPQWLSGKESACQCRRLEFDPWVGKIPWSRTRQPTAVFPLEIPWTEEPGGLYSLQGCKELDTT